MKVCIWAALILSTAVAPVMAQERPVFGSRNPNAPPVQQEFAMMCEFTSECYETESCGETQYSIDLEGETSGLETNAMVASVQLSSDIGTEDLVGVVQDETTSLSGGTFSARHFLTIAPNGAARYTVHYAEGPLMISYLGECR
ncbi:MAG: hypothetical protein ABJH45_24275 [Paracoccaceae bacterium]